MTILELINSELTAQHRSKSAIESLSTHFSSLFLKHSSFYITKYHIIDLYTCTSFMWRPGNSTKINVKWYSFGATQENTVIFETWLNPNTIILHSTSVHLEVRLPNIDGFMTDSLYMDTQIGQEVWGGVRVSQLQTICSPSDKGKPQVWAVQPQLLHAERQCKAIKAGTWTQVLKCKWMTADGFNIKLCFILFPHTWSDSSSNSCTSFNIHMLTSVSKSVAALESSKESTSSELKMHHSTWCYCIRNAGASVLDMLRFTAIVNQQHWSSLEKHTLLSLQFSLQLLFFLQYRVDAWRSTDTTFITGCRHNHPLSWGPKPT